MYFVFERKKLLGYISLFIFTVAVVSLLVNLMQNEAKYTMVQTNEKKYIKWIDFDVSYAAMEKALELDIKSHTDPKAEHLYNWIEILAYLATKYGGDFKRYSVKDIDTLIKKINEGKSVSEIAEGMKHYSYYIEAFTAILVEFVGHYKIEVQNEAGNKEWVQKYGLKVFSPIARTYPYNDYDDFGAGRTYGYRRLHLGHDLMAATGTPVVAVESGIVEELGWNQYGGWRIGIRSFDTKRYYYYAHLRKDYPYAKSLVKGRDIKAGDVIGYVGRTGYSSKENVNNITQSHLHFGLQIIFDESQKDGVNQIWINLYELTRLLQKNRVSVQRAEGSKEFKRVYNFIETQNQKSKLDLFFDKLRPTMMQTGEQHVAVPIIMYHSLLKNPSNSSRYTITPTQFEQDLKYLKENGYHTIVMEDLIRYVYEGVTLPSKPIILTFDDGHFNNYYYAYPLLKEYGMKAVVSVVGAYSEDSSKREEENPNYSYITWTRLSEMVSSGVFEIQNHSYGLHVNNKKTQGIRQKKGEGYEAYSERLTKDILKLQDKLYEETSYKPTTFTYPFGIVSSNAADILKDMGFKATLGCVEGINIVTKSNPESLFNLKRNIRANMTLNSVFFEKLEKQAYLVIKKLESEELEETLEGQELVNVVSLCE